MPICLAGSIRNNKSTGRAHRPRHKLGHSNNKNQSRNEVSCPSSSRFSAAARRLLFVPRRTSSHQPHRHSLPAKRHLPFIAEVPGVVLGFKTNHEFSSQTKITFCRCNYISGVVHAVAAAFRHELDVDTPLSYVQSFSGLVFRQASTGVQ